MGKGIEILYRLPNIFPTFAAMKRFISIGFLFLFLMAACTHRGGGFLLPADQQDAEYALLIDSVETIFDDFKYHDFTDSLVSPALAFYEKGDTPRCLWMQARCHYLTGCIVFDKNHRSEKATMHIMEALNILDSHFDARQAPVGRLYSKICFVLSRIAYNFSDEPCSTRYARYGLDYASAVGDTAWILHSMSNLGLLYERFGKRGEGDTAFFYCNEGLRIADADRFPFETALLENSLANCLRHSHQYDSAIFYFEQCFALIDSSYPLYHRTAMEKAFVHFMAKDYAAAMADLEIAYQSKDENLKTQAAYGLADCYEKLGDTLRAMPYYALVKTHEENKVVASNHNAEVMQMLNAYLKEKEARKGREWILWLLLLFGVSAVVVILMRRRHRKHLASQEAEAQRQLNEALQRHDETKRQLQTKVERAAQHTKDVLEKRVMGIYLSGDDDRLQRIFGDFESVYPNAVEKLKANHPELTEQECNVVVLSFLRFRAKEMAELLGLTEGTVQKYRSNIRKKAGNDPISEVI